MSAVAGIVHLDGGPASTRDLDVLLGSMGPWGSCRATVTADGASFGYVGARTYLPRACHNGSAIITAHARLDNRDELCDRLDVSAPDQINLSDESLLVRAFERWGEACAQHLNGDWSFAVWFPARRELFLARDHFGNTGLYFARVGERLAFASDIKALLALHWLPRRLNETRVASLLIGGGADDPSCTAYCDISRLPPAHVVTVTKEEERFGRYWRLEEIPNSGPSGTRERVDLLRATLRTAVATRLNGTQHPGAMLSGGLDSGAVTALAAEYLEKRHRRLTAFTSVPAFPIHAIPQGAARTDEGPAAAEIVGAFTSIDHVLVAARGVSPLLGVRRGLAIHREPLLAAANYGWMTELMGEAQSRGIDVLLTGQVGDFVMAGPYPAQNWSHDWSAHRYRAMLKRFMPNWFLRVRRTGWKPWRLNEPPWRNFSAISAEFAAETRLLERLRDAGADPRNMKSQPGQAAIARQAMSHIGAIWAPLGASFGLTILDPLQDKRVIEQMFSRPRPPEAAGTDRWLFRQSLVGVLEKDVLTGRRKHIQSADIVERLLASWAEVEEVLGLAEHSPLARRCVDVRYCRTLADSIRDRPASPHSRRKAFVLVNGLAAALFLAETWTST